MLRRCPSTRLSSTRSSAAGGRTAPSMRIVAAVSRGGSALGGPTRPDSARPERADQLRPGTTGGAIGLPQRSTRRRRPGALARALRRWRRRRVRAARRSDRLRQPSAGRRTHRGPGDPEDTRGSPEEPSPRSRRPLVNSSRRPAVRQQNPRRTASRRCGSRSRPSNGRTGSGRARTARSRSPHRCSPSCVWSTTCWRPATCTSGSSCASCRHSRRRRSPSRYSPRSIGRSNASCSLAS